MSHSPLNNGENDIMSKLRVEIVQDAKNVVFHPSPNRVAYPEDKGSPLLKRRAPKRPAQKLKSVKKDD